MKMWKLQMYVNFINMTLVNNDHAFLSINIKHTFSFYSVEWFIMKYLTFFNGLSVTLRIDSLINSNDVLLGCKQGFHC